MRAVRIVTSVSLAAALAACSHPSVPANHAGDEDSLRQLGASFDDAWQRKDPRARAGLFADDATLINPFGARATGRADIERVFGVETQTIANGTTHRFGAMTVRFLDPDHALVDADNVVDGIRTPDGAAAPPLRYHLAGVAERREGRWMWLAGRPYAFLPQPPDHAASASR